ncbi:hypothetical protein AYO08_29945 [Pseudomonas putida]|nr:hypothetical protein AYO08_29945 [Pseudomonas putida]
MDRLRNIDLIAVNAAVRAFAFDQITSCVVAEVGVFTPGIDAFAQAAMGVVVIQRLGIAAVAVAEQLTARVPAQVFALFEGIGDLGNTAFRVVLVLCLAPQRVLLPEQIAVAVVAVLPSPSGE